MADNTTYQIDRLRTIETASNRVGEFLQQSLFEQDSVTQTSFKNNGAKETSLIALYTEYLQYIQTLTTHIDTTSYPASQLLMELGYLNMHLVSIVKKVPPVLEIKEVENQPMALQLIYKQHPNEPNLQAWLLQLQNQYLNKKNVFRLFAASVCIFTSAAILGGPVGMGIAAAALFLATSILISIKSRLIYTTEVRKDKKVNMSIAYCLTPFSESKNAASEKDPSKEKNDKQRQDELEECVQATTRCLSFHSNNPTVNLMDINFTQTDETVDDTKKSKGKRFDKEMSFLW